MQWLRALSGDAGGGYGAPSWKQDQQHGEPSGKARQQKTLVCL